ncbi:MAG TPA: tetratricopeptide repeat protein [bacterium]|nr:tetratricopeptide repeat protein [bacterium]
MKKKKLLKALLIVVVVIVVVVVGLIINFRYQVNKYLATLEPEERLLSEISILMALKGYDNKKAVDKAIEKCKEAIEINPNSAKAYSQLGNLYRTKYRTKDMFKKAETSWKKAIELDPTYPEPHYNLGWYYSLEERYDEAIKEFQKTLELDPGYKGIQKRIERTEFEKLEKELKGLRAKDSKELTQKDKERIAYLEKETDKRSSEWMEKAGITDEDLIREGKKYGFTKEDLGL